MKENSIEEDIEVIESIIEEYENCCVPEIDMQVNVTFREKQNNALNNILSDYRRVLKENEELKEDYYNVINKIENKIDRFDYEFEKAKRQNNKDKSDYYWDLIRNLKKIARKRGINERGRKESYK